jgi:3-hydroxyisobutyrate dehydrogenase-like beta-hydroxyacid dehydrogenase
MGGRMTRRLVAAGFRVVGYDARAGQAASAGAVGAEALGEVCEGTEVVLLSLPDSRAVESVVLGAAANLGYGELISNRVVDAIGDLAGGVRLYDTNTEA